MDTFFHPCFGHSKWGDVAWSPHWDTDAATAAAILQDGQVHPSWSKVTVAVDYIYIDIDIIYIYIVDYILLYITVTVTHTFESVSVDSQMFWAFEGFLYVLSVSHVRKWLNRLSTGGRSFYGPRALKRCNWRLLCLAGLGAEMCWELLVWPMTKSDGFKNAVLSEHFSLTPQLFCFQ